MIALWDVVMIAQALIVAAAVAVLWLLITEQEGQR